MFRKIHCPRWIICVGVLSVVLLVIILFQNINYDTVATAETKGVSLPVIMYHSFLNDTSLQNNYTIPPKVLEDDLKYIKENGFSTVTPSDLLEYVKGGELPEKVVMLTFDDGFYNNYSYAFPLLKKYNAKAVLSPVASFSLEYSQNGIVSENYGYCTFEMLKVMDKSGCVEIANHSYNMHKTSPRFGISRIKGEGEQAYEKALTDDLMQAQKLFDKNKIKKPVCLTYPYGIESPQTLPIVKKLGFKCTLTCQEKTNIIYRDKSCLFELGRYLRLKDESSQNLFERICK